ASLEMALARLAGLGQLKSLEELITALQSGATASPAAGGEKKNPEPLRSAPAIDAPLPAAPKFTSAVRQPAPAAVTPVDQAAAPNSAGDLSFPNFVAYLLQ